MALRPILKALPPFLPSPNLDSSSNYDPYCTYDANLLTPYTGALPFASSSRIPPLDSPHVHFPPTPTLTQIAITHSAYSYDRKPIEVLPNVLALPERGDRKVGMDTSGIDAAPGANCEDGYFHPRVYVREVMGADLEPSEPVPSLLFAPGTRHSGISSPWSFSLYPNPNPHPHQNNSHRPRDSIDVHSFSIPPPLVSDNSSESDSDMCGSPPAAGLSSSMPHISVHFSGLSKGPPSPSPSLKRIRSAAEVDFGVGAKPKMQTQHWAKERPECGFGDVLNRTKCRTKKVINSACSSASASCSSSNSGFGSFGEAGLDGCLGGF